MQDLRPDPDTIAIPAPHPAPGPAAPPVLEIAVPVFNEEQALAPGIERLHAYLSSRFPFSWRITIVDNASTDGTWAVARRLGRELANVSVRHLREKGRGRALRAAWSASDAAVVAYTDIDLSTDLDALLPMVAPLVSGHSDIAIGSRLSPGSSVARGPKRELISRSYNLILRTVFATRVRDAQCGFKAVRADVARRLLPAVEDEGWFFDTELLVLAEHNGLRIHEVPVDWVDDTDSRVDVTRTALDDLRGTARLVRAFAAGRGRLELGPAARPPIGDDFGRSIVSFATIGAISTVVSLVLYLATRDALGAVGANVVAVSATFVGNTWANARFTAGVRRPRWRLAGAVYVGSLAVTSAALLVVIATGGSRAAEVAVLLVTWMAVAVGRFALVRSHPNPDRHAA